MSRQILRTNAKSVLRKKHCGPIICYKLLSKLLTAQTDTKEMTTTTVIGISTIIESFLTAQDRAPTLVPAASSDTALGQAQEVCCEALAKVLQDKEDSKQIPFATLSGLPSC